MIMWCIFLSSYKAIHSIQTKTAYQYIYEFIIFYTVSTFSQEKNPYKENDCNSRPQKQGTISPRANTKQSW